MRNETNPSGVAVASLGSAQVLSVDLPPEPSSATRSRELARLQLAGLCSRDILDTTLLVVTELVTNAILHARTMMRLSIEVRPQCVRLGVEDHAAALPQRVQLDPHAITGRGLTLVEKLSSSWGVDSLASGKVVWSEIAI
jgi:anti-sigma regulatory factor (Ser/Thr protein kinase)